MVSVISSMFSFKKTDDLLGQKILFKGKPAFVRITIIPLILISIKLTHPSYSTINFLHKSLTWVLKTYYQIRKSKPIFRRRRRLHWPHVKMNRGLIESEALRLVWIVQRSLYKMKQIDSILGSLPERENKNGVVKYISLKIELCTQFWALRQ